MDNVESASVAGDSFPTTRVLTADGVVSLIGCLMSNPFINAVYIGHPGWKAMGGRIGCLRRHLKPTNDSWRLDETYVRVKGQVALPLPGGGLKRSRTKSRLRSDSSDSQRPSVRHRGGCEGQSNAPLHS
jgi:hypothetical protein